jgi:type II secretory ATPase GspE/PulE/Tfp pilus assembly ATPase PilB-like protein
LTTTLYSLILGHDAFIQNIHTLEQEYLTEIDIITQHLMEKGPEARTGAQQLRSVLHADPDVIMVGRCNEPEMAKMATKAVTNTGKKLYIGIPAASTFQALSEWLKMVGDNKKVANSLLAIINQKLLRILCKECREGYAPDVTMLKKLNLPADKIKQFFRPPTELEYDKHGNPIICENCQGTGYYGRTAVFETLFVTDGLRKLIAEDVPINVLRTECRKSRMLFLQEQALRKVIDGTTSIQEVLRITTEAPQKRPAKKSG